MRNEDVSKQPAVEGRARQVLSGSPPGFGREERFIPGRRSGPEALGHCLSIPAEMS